MARQRRSRRERGQSIVEFGIVSILFTLLMFAVVDFGLLLNGWLTVSADAQKLARDAAVGSTQAELLATASSYGIPGVTADAGYFSSYCCDPNTSALALTVTYYDECTPGVAGCNPVSVMSTLDHNYGAGTCNTAPCAHPGRPSAGGTTTCPGPGPCPGDTVVVTLTARGARVITPLVRPFFHCSDGGAAPCFVPLSSTATMRFDGSGL